MNPRASLSFSERLRRRTERRRLRALFDAGERLEAAGLLDEPGRLHAALTAAPAQPLPAPPELFLREPLGIPLARPQPRAGCGRRLLGVVGALGAPLLGLAVWIGRQGWRPRPGSPQPRLWLGAGTGLAHARAPWARPRGRVAVLAGADLGQNLLILGGIGSGKTTSVIQPILLQTLAQGLGGLVFDVKGDFGRAAAALARATGRSLTVIGPGRRSFSLLQGLTPESAASFLKSALLLGGSPSDPFWIETAVELCRNALGVLSFLPDRYTLAGLYDYLFREDVRADCDRRVRAEAAGLSPQALRLLRSYQAYHEGVFTRFDAKVIAGVLASAAQVLTPFTHPDLVDAFCPSRGGLTLEPLATGAVFLVDLPLAVWGLGAKVVYTFLKLRFFQYLQSRPLADRARHLLFLCDEYQEIVSANKDGLSDLNFWDKGRAFGVVGVISAQSVASFYAALGDRAVTDTLLQNFRQKLCLRTEDLHTIAYFERLLGRRLVRPGRELALIPAALMRRLYHRQALAVLSVGGEAVEEVLDLPTVYVD